MNFHFQMLELCVLRQVPGKNAEIVDFLILWLSFTYVSCVMYTLVWMSGVSRLPY